MPNQSGWVGHSRVLIPKRQIGNCWRAGFNCGSTSPIRRKHRLFERWAVPAIAASADPVGDLVEQPGFQTTKYHKIQISNQRNCARQLQVQIQDFSRWHCCCTFTGAQVERYNVHSFLNRRHPQCELGPFQLLHFQEYAFRKKKRSVSHEKQSQTPEPPTWCNLHAPGFAWQTWRALRSFLSFYQGTCTSGCHQRVRVTLDTPPAPLLIWKSSVCCPPQLDR